MDNLLTFVEISVAIGGFTSIIMVFKDSNKSTWNSHLFAGLILHVLIAFVFGLAPSAFLAFTNDELLIASICSLILGLYTVIQPIITALVDKKTKLPVILYTLTSGVIVGVILVLNSFGYYFKQTFEAYSLGIIWHLLQSMIIFAMIITQSGIKK